jgi:hypothetical protein
VSGPSGSVADARGARARPAGAVGRWAAGLLGWLIEATIRTWVRVLGRTVAEGEAGWLVGPVGPSGRVGAGSYQHVAAAAGWTIRPGGADSGQIEEFRALKGPSFDPDRVHPRVADFYEHTSRYQLDAWSQWSWLFRPFGWALVSFVSRRIEQLNFPIGPLETSRGMTSEIIKLVDGRGQTAYTGWLRRMVATGGIVYAGLYTIERTPNSPGPCVKGVFPLPEGSATVFLEPRAEPDGSFTLFSSGRRFGDPGFYRALDVGRGRRRVRYIRAMKETIHLFVDEQDVLRAEHVFRFFRVTILRLHYKITPKAP